MAKLSEKTETQKATEALSNNLNSLNIIAKIENKKAASPTLPSSTSQNEKKTLVTFNLPANDLEKYKMWLGGKGLSLSMGIRMCLDYVFYEDNKKLLMTKSGIRENEIIKL